MDVSGDCKQIVISSERHVIASTDIGIRDPGSGFDPGFGIRGQWSGCRITIQGTMFFAWNGVLAAIPAIREDQR